MGRGTALLLVVFFVHVAGASATFLCVPNTSIPGGPSSGSASEPTIGDAVNNAAILGDTVLIGAGTYNEAVDDTGKSLSFVGAGPTRTIIQGQGSPAFNVQSTRTSVRNLGINLYNEQGGTGLALAGIADNVAVTSNGLNNKDSIGVALTGGTFTHGSVSLPVNQLEETNFGGVVGNGTLSDSSVTAGVGVTWDTSGNMPTVHRAHVLANQGVSALASFIIDDSVIRTVPGASPGQVGIGTSPSAMTSSMTIRHVDIIGSGESGSVGLGVSADGVTMPTSSSALLSSSIIRGYANSISASAVGTLFKTTATVSIDHSFFDPSTQHSSASGVGGSSAQIKPDQHSGNFDPKFVNAAAGNFHLQASSPAIDAGHPLPLASGESASDLDDHSRAVAGRKGDAAIPDVGAYEFVPHAPAVSASASHLKLAAGKPDSFHAVRSDPSPGDVVSFHWNFGDGHSASGASVTHSFVKAGHHHVTVTATDLDGFTATASLTVTATGPSISKLTIKPKILHAGHGATISYQDSQAAKTTFRLLHAKGSKVLASFSHQDKAGKNHVHLSGHGLKPGRYRLEAIPHNHAGKGKPRFVKFTVVA
jgi:hypothetical protein